MSKSTGRPTKAQKARLLAKIEKRGPDECWPWTGSIGTWGYGSFWLDSESGNMNAHRAAYMLLVGEIAPGLVVCHRCDRPICCNPKHLFLGTPGDNVRDCNAKGRARGQFSDLLGVKHPRFSAVLNEETVREARSLYSQGVTQTALGKRFGISSSQMSRVVRGLSWVHIK